MDITPKSTGGRQQSDENLRMISHCPLCHQAYNPVKAKVLEERGDSHLLYIKCQRCHCAVLALVMASSMGVSSIGLVTDLQSYEVARFDRLGPVTDNDLLAGYEQIGQSEFLAELTRS